MFPNVPSPLVLVPSQFCPLAVRHANHEFRAAPPLTLRLEQASKLEGGVN